MPEIQASVQAISASPFENVVFFKDGRKANMAAGCLAKLCLKHTACKLFFCRGRAMMESTNAHIHARSGGLSWQYKVSINFY